MPQQRSVGQAFGMPHLFGDVEHFDFDAQMVGGNQDDRFADVIGCFFFLHGGMCLFVYFKFVFGNLDLESALADAGPPLIPAFFDQFDAAVAEVWFI